MAHLMQKTICKFINDNLLKILACMSILILISLAILYASGLNSHPVLLAIIITIAIFVFQLHDINKPVSQITLIRLYFFCLPTLTAFALLAI